MVLVLVGKRRSAKLCQEAGHPLLFLLGTAVVLINHLGSEAVWNTLF